jgi:hypothetical protein
MKPCALWMSEERKSFATEQKELEKKKISDVRGEKEQHKIIIN